MLNKKKIMNYENKKKEGCNNFFFLQNTLVSRIFQIKTKYIETKS